MAAFFKGRTSPPTAPTTARSTRTNGWRCTFCLKRLAVSDLEWRCPNNESCSRFDAARPPTTHRLLIGDNEDALRPNALLHQEEQSYPCPSKGCALVHSDIYVTGCDAPQRTELALAPERVYHTALIPIDHDIDALGVVFAAHLLAPRLLDTLINRSVPDYLTSSLFSQGLQQGSRQPAGEGIGPFGTRLHNSRQLYFHWAPLKDGDRTLAMLSGRRRCAGERPDWIERCLAMDTLTLSYRLGNVQGPRRVQIRERARELAENFRNTVSLHPERYERLPELRFVLSSERDLARLIRQPLELPSERELRAQVIEGYVLDTLGLRSLLAPLLALPWMRVSSGFVQVPLTAAAAVRGLSDWFVSLAESR